MSARHAALMDDVLLVKCLLTDPYSPRMADACRRALKARSKTTIDALNAQRSALPVAVLINV